MLVNILSSKEVNEKIKNKEFKLIIDLRDNEEYLTGHLPKAINIPFYQVNDYIEFIRSITNEDILICCSGGNKSNAVGKVLLINEFKNIFTLKNGMKSYKYELEQ